MERSGGAERLTGRPWAQPELRARTCVYRGVIARAGAQRPCCPEPVACAWTAAPAPVSAASVARGSRGLPLSRTWHELANDFCAATSLRRTVRGHREVSRPQRTSPPSRCDHHLDGDSASIRVWCRHVVSGPAWGNPARTRGQRPTTPRPTSRNQGTTSAPRESRSLDNRGPHKGSVRG
jgi:hypothetical protein